MAEKKVKAEPVHLDKLGHTLKVGDCIATAHFNKLIIATVVKLNAKMVKICELGSKWNREHNKYPDDLVVLDGPEVTMYLLTRV